MRQLITILVLLITAPWAAVAYIVVRMMWEVRRRHVNAERNRFATPASAMRFEQLHQERVFRVRNVGQTVR